MGAKGGLERWSRKVDSKGGLERWTRKVDAKCGREKWARKVGAEDGLNKVLTLKLTGRRNYPNHKSAKYT